MSGKIEARLAELGITLPPAFAPAANYLGWQIDGNLLYIAGQGPVKQDGGLVTGRVGSDLTVEEGYDAARHTALELVAHTKVALEGDLDRVKRWVIFNGEAEASRVSPDWHGWLHHTWDEPPTQTPLAHKTWEKPHQANLTGTVMAHAPAGSLRNATPQSTSDYEAWVPE